MEPEILLWQKRVVDRAYSAFGPQNIVRQLRVWLLLLCGEQNRVPAKVMEILPLVGGAEDALGVRDVPVRQHVETCVVGRGVERSARVRSRIRLPYFERLILIHVWNA